MNVTHYQLTAEVINPEADRRHKRNFTKQTVWPAGMRFTRHDVEGWAPTLKHPSLLERLTIANAGFDLLLANAEPVEPSIAELLDQSFVRPIELLEHLDIDRDTIIAAIAAIEAKLED